MVHWFIEMLGFAVAQPNLRAILLKRITHDSHVAPLGLGSGGMPPFYKHVAPLGLKTLFFAFPFSRLLCVLCASAVHLLRITFLRDSHVAPLGLGSGGMPPVYKHVAPLGLNSQRFVQSNIYVNRSLRLCRRF